MRIPGLVVPPLTPFDDQGEVDLPALERMVDYVVEDCDAAMVVAAGVEAQEYQCLTLEARRDLIARTVEYVDGRRPVVVGISHPSYRVAVELAAFAADLGAAAVQVLAPLRPFGGEPTVTDLERYIDAVVAEISLPVMLYLNPGPGADPSVTATVELASRPQVHFLKESSRDLARVGRLIAEIDRADLARYFTTMQMLLTTLELGGSGGTLPPPAARIGALVLEAFTRGDHRTAAELQAQFGTYPHRWMQHGLTPVMKASMTALGLPVGAPFPPYAPLEGDEFEQLQAHLATTALTTKES